MRGLTPRVGAGPGPSFRSAAKASLPSLACSLAPDRAPHAARSWPSPCPSCPALCAYQAHRGGPAQGREGQGGRQGQGQGGSPGSGHGRGKCRRPQEGGDASRARCNGAGRRQQLHRFAPPPPPAHAVANGERCMRAPSHAPTHAHARPRTPTPRPPAHRRVAAGDGEGKGRLLLKQGLESGKQPSADAGSEARCLRPHLRSPLVCSRPPLPQRACLGSTSRTRRTHTPQHQRWLPCSPALNPAGSLAQSVATTPHLPLHCVVRSGARCVLCVCVSDHSPPAPHLLLSVRAYCPCVPQARPDVFPTRTLGRKQSQLEVLLTGASPPCLPPSVLPSLHPSIPSRVHVRASRSHNTAHSRTSLPPMSPSPIPQPPAPRALPQAASTASGRSRASSRCPPRKRRAGGAKPHRSKRRPRHRATAKGRGRGRGRGNARRRATDPARAPLSRWQRRGRPMGKGAGGNLAGKGRRLGFRGRAHSAGTSAERGAEGGG